MVFSVSSLLLMCQNLYNPLLLVTIAIGFTVASSKITFRLLFDWHCPFFAVVNQLRSNQCLVYQYYCILQEAWVSQDADNGSLGNCPQPSTGHWRNLENVCCHSEHEYMIYTSLYNAFIPKRTCWRALCFAHSLAYNTFKRTKHTHTLTRTYIGPRV